MPSILTFKTSDTNLGISGKTYTLRQYLKSIGAMWEPMTSTWLLCISKDTPEFRKMIQQKLDDSLNAEKEEKKMKNISSQSIHHNNAFFLNALKAKEKNPSLYSWICCDKCIVMDWRRKHTVCEACSCYGFRVRGMVYTGD
jgi:hypothetical protein